MQNRQETLPQLRLEWMNYGVTASKTTISRRLKEVGLSAHVAKKKPMLTAQHRRKRLQFALAHANWTVVNWSVVLWSDESRFTLFKNDGRVYVRRRQNEAFMNSCVVPTMKHGGGGVTVWGAMSFRGTAFLTPITGNLNKDGYIDILANSAVPSAHFLGYGNNFIFQDDGAPCHRARAVDQWKANNNIRSLEWPAQSPDLNPIENLWKDLGKAVRNRRCRNLAELRQELGQCWGQIAARRCRSLVRSMPRRIRAVIRARGGYTKY